MTYVLRSLWPILSFIVAPLAAHSPGTGFHKEHGVVGIELHGEPANLGVAQAVAGNVAPAAIDGHGQIDLTRLGAKVERTNGIVAVVVPAAEADELLHGKVIVQKVDVVAAQCSMAATRPNQPLDCL